MSKDTGPSAAKLGAAFLFFGLALGATTGLAATGAVAPLVREASVPEPLMTSASLPAAAPLPQSGGANEPVAFFEIDDEPAGAARPLSATAQLRAQQAKARRADAARTLRHVTVETSSTLGALLEEDARARAMKR